MTEASGAPTSARASATLADVAAAAGVSLATASRVLNGSTRKVAAAYRERVERAAESLGYTTNVLAQATARGNSSVIALLVADISDPYFGLIASGVARGADEDGAVVSIAVTDRDPRKERAILRSLLGQRPRGVILAASRDADEDRTLDELAPFSAFGSRAVLFGAGRPEYRTIQFDNRGAARDLGDRMARLGYRQAIVLGAAEGVHTADERIDGFVSGFTAAGGAHPSIWRDASFSRESGAAVMRAVLQQGVRPGTVVFGMSDVIAVGAMAAIREAGRDVGGDIAVCGFDAIPVSLDVTPQLTTVHLPLEEAGYLAYRAIADEEWQAPELLGDVHVRASTPGL